MAKRYPKFDVQYQPARGDKVKCTIRSVYYCGHTVGVTRTGSTREKAFADAHSRFLDEITNEGRKCRPRHTGNP